MLSPTEENYLKAIYSLSEKKNGEFVNTNSIAKKLQTTAASVTDMIKRLNEKNYVLYQKYKGVQLTDDGTSVAKNLIRNHRLWEVFLETKLEFSWDEVHEIAEQLEHIKSDTLIDRLDKFLEYPKFDPHGDPIPDKDGNIIDKHSIILADLQAEQCGTIVGVKEHSPEFLRYLDELELILGTKVIIVASHQYDDTKEVKINGAASRTISNKVAKNLYVEIQNT